MSVEIRKIRGPLTEEQLGWITSLYGPVDPKYGSLDFVRHQFVGNPYGWSAHAFALTEEGPVAHVGVVPFHARLGSQPLAAGKIEAVVVAESHRGGRTESGGSIAVETMSAAYALAHENGIRMLFGLAPPRVAAVHARAGCKRVTVEAPTHIFVGQPLAAARDWSPRRKAAAVCLSLAQNTVLGLLYVATRPVAGRRLRIEPLRPDDADLAVASVGDGEWTVSGFDAWDWYAGSGALHAIEIGGPFGSRAIVRLGARGSSLEIVAWRPRRTGLVPGLLLLVALARIARRNSAPTLRFQPWPGQGGNGALARACRTLGLVQRRETELVLHVEDPELASADVQLTPFFHVTF
jgi:hypothetical protein